MQAVREGDFVFPGSKLGQGSATGDAHVAHRSSQRRELTVHGFRRRFGIGAPSRPRFRPRSPNSPSPTWSATKVEQAYLRSDFSRNAASSPRHGRDIATRQPPKGAWCRCGRWPSRSRIGSAGIGGTRKARTPHRVSLLSHCGRLRGRHAIRLDYQSNAGLYRR